MDENYIYYKYDGTNSIYPIPYNYEVRISRKVCSIHELKFWFFSLGRFMKYQIWHGDTLCATAEVCPKLFIFAFIPHRKNAIHIGPCFTYPNFRRKGLFVSLLQRITNDYYGKDIYIFAHKNNIASNKGIIKAGFSPYAKGNVSRFGIYKINKNL